MSVFNQQLSKAQQQQAGVVDKTAGMGAALAGNILKQGQEAYSQEQLRQFNNEVNTLMDQQTQEQQDPEKQRIIQETNDEVEQELLRQKQGIIDKNQFERSIQAIAAKKKASAVFHGKEIDDIVNNALGKNTNNYAQRTKNELGDISNQALQEQAKEREELSYSLFGKSSLTLTDNESDKLFNLIRKKRETVARDIENKSIITLNKSKELSQEEKEQNAKTFSYNSSINLNDTVTGFADMFNTNIESMYDKGQLTDEAYNASLIRLKTDTAKRINKYIKDCKEAGYTPDQKVIDSANNIVKINEESYSGYKEFTKENIKNKNLKDYMFAKQVEKEELQSQGQQATNIKDTMYILDNPVFKRIDSPDEKLSGNTAMLLNETLYNKYNKEGKFDKAGYKKELLKTITGNNEDRVKNEGINNIIESNKAILNMPDYSVDTILRGDNLPPDPKTKSINFLQGVQDGYINDILKNVPSNIEESIQTANKAYKFLESNLKMYNSDKFQYGVPNSELSTTRQEAAADSFVNAGAKLQEIIKRNPDSVSVNNKGDITISTSEGNQMLQEYFIAAAKMDNPVSKKKVVDTIVKIKQDAIQNEVIEPLIQAAHKELDENPMYVGLSKAQKNNIVLEAVNKNRDIKLAQTAKDLEIEKTNQTLKQIGETNSAYGGNYYRTIKGNVDKVLNGNAIEKIKAGMYFYGSIDNGIKSIVNDVTKTAKSLFGDSIQDQVEDVAMDKKLGIGRAQARIVKKLMSKETDYQDAKEGYDVVSISLKELKNKAIQGDDLSTNEEKRMRYYEQYIKAYNKSYEKELKQEANALKKQQLDEMVNQNASDLIDRVVDYGVNTIVDMSEEEAEGYTEEDLKKNNEEEMKYNLTFNNEIGTGAYESKKLHKPSANSGITIGAGYDLKHREKAEIKNDLLEAGLSNEDAEIISNGAGLAGDDAEKFLKENSNITITEEQQEKLFEKVVPVYEARAINGYEKIDLENKPNYEDLPQKVKDLLVDYAYNVGVETFPKFFKAVIKGDEETALNQYKRYTDGKPLGKRNEDTLSLLKSYDFKDLTV